MAGGEQTQVLVRFVTRLPPELQVPATEVAVPASLKRYGLSQIINHLLALEPVRPFDFIIDGELLRKTLEQHLLEHGMSPEVVVEVEYVPAVLPPEPKAAIPQNDWVTAVAGVQPGSCLASGAADGIVRLWNAAGHCGLEFAAHKGGVNALAAAVGQQQQQQQQSSRLLLSAGKDHALKLWQLTLSSQQQLASSGASARCIATCQGHREAVQAVAASPGGSHCCSGGWDGQLLLWRTGQQVADEAAAAAEAAAAKEPAGGAKKKRRTADGAAAAAPAPLVLEPLAALPGHVHCVATVAWAQPDVLFSGGWDHSVRRYDVETRTNTDTYNGSKAVLAVAAPAGGGGGGASPDLVAFAGSDRVLRLWDSRAVGGEGLAVKAYTAHGEGWVSSLAWRPGSAHQLASGGHDGAVRLWDTRSPVPLGSLTQHAADAKVLALGWWGPATLVSGGSDCRLQLYALP